MPFSADALAAAVARQTGAEVIVPPSPGTVGAQGIALLAREAPAEGRARRSTWRGSSPPASSARRPSSARPPAAAAAPGTSAGSTGSARWWTGERQAFTWGGACSLFDHGTRTQQAARTARRIRSAPAPTRWTSCRRGSAPRRGGRPRVAVADAFQLKSLFPYFAALLRGLGLDPVVVRPGGRDALARGIEAANVPFCAPMQQYHGVAAAMADVGAELAFLPMIQDLPPVRDEKHTWLCPIVQSAPDVVRRDLGDGAPRARPLAGDPDRRRLPRVGAVPGRHPAPWRARSARRRAPPTRPTPRRARSSSASSGGCGRSAARRWSAAATRGSSRWWSSGARTPSTTTCSTRTSPRCCASRARSPIPLDCYPVEDEAPLVPGAFWSYTQRILRAAHQVRRTPGVYSLFTSNYACGPDSFTLPHYARIMQGKPFAIIETDGHSADAGTKTRVEAFLHCVREDLRSGASAARPAPLRSCSSSARRLADVAASGGRVLVPPMGPEAEGLAAALRGVRPPGRGAARRPPRRPSRSGAGTPAARSACR